MFSSSWHADQRHHARQIKLEARRLHCKQSQRVRQLQNLVRNVERRIAEAQQDPRKSPLELDDIALLQQSIRDVDKLTVDVKNDHAILRSLSFAGQSARQSAIPEAHKQTFGWVFSPISSPSPSSSPSSESHDSQPSDLLSWLESGDGVFWVSGKPGSGKSTFMKFLVGDERTQQALSKCSHPKTTIIASHYFWCAGSPMERSQQGLVRALLLEVLRQCPDFIEPLCRHRWGTSDSLSLLPDWTMAEIFRALHEVVTRDDFPSRLCFFIDGLDEYEGDHLELCRELQTLTKSGNIKLCLSSRPWSVFMDAFGASSSSSRQLCLHDLTRSDMEKYVQQRLIAHPSWNTLHDETLSMSFVRETASRSQGVFLWTYLVTEMLRDEMSPSTAFPEWQARLESLPTDLDALFEYMLDDVDSSLQQKMATSFLVALEADRALHISTYYFHDIEYTDSGYVLNLPLEPPSRSELRRNLAQTTRVLNKRCRGLLETDDKTASVSFLHRTARDHFEPPEVRTKLVEKAPECFNADRCLLKAFAACIKSSRASTAEETRVEFLSDLQSLCSYAARIEEQLPAHRSVYHLILDNLDETLLAKGPTAEESLHLLRVEVIRKRLASYLLRILPRQPTYQASLEVPALVAALFPTYRPGDAVTPPAAVWTKRTVATISNLVRFGADPNEEFAMQDVLVSKNSKTPWTMLCEEAIPHYQEDHAGSIRRTMLYFRSALEQGLFAVLLDHGAAAHAACDRPGKSSSFVCVDYLFASFHVAGETALETLYLDQLEGFLSRCPESWRSSLGTFFSRVGFEANQRKRRFEFDFVRRIIETVFSLQPGLRGDPDLPWELIDKVCSRSNVE